MTWSPAIERRYERKFEILELERSEVESILRFNPGLFREIFARRWVNNIYFDTWSNACYEETESGDSRSRTKIRIRWYGELRGAVESGVLEFKIRQGQVNHKVSFPLDPFEMRAGLHVATIRDLFRTARIPESLLHQVMKLEMVLVNRYSRSYYLSADQRFRATIDTDLTYRGADPRSGCQAEERKVVLELKYDPSDDEEAHRITQHFPFRLTRNSKFVCGVELLQARRGF